jgi:hypothetical protein
MHMPRGPALVCTLGYRTPSEAAQAVLRQLYVSDVGAESSQIHFGVRILLKDGTGLRVLRYRTLGVRPESPTSRKCD